VTSYVVVVAVLLGAALLARRLSDSTLAWWDARPIAVHSRWMPGAIALLTAAITAWVWGHAIAPTAVVHDEASYLFQARIFAHGAFAMPAPPLPEFFEQFHVYVTPAFASKYPPGHALLLAPGLLLGWPALMPLLLAAVTGALVFLLARRASNGWVAFMTWLIWITAKDTLHPLASWFSQSSSGALWLLGWWALWSWRDTGRRSWLVALAACIGWLAITRPLTAVAYAATAGAVVLARTARRRSWPDLVPALVLGVAILALIPYANWRTTGRWRVMPYSEYSKIYFPFDAPGFGVDSSAPRRALPPDMVRFAVATRLVHVGYEPAALPRALVSRLAHVATGMWSGPRVVLGAVALLAIPSIGAEVGLALASVLVLALCYLSFAHPAGWTLYYTEILPVLALLSGMGLWRLLGADPRPTAESPSRRASAADAPVRARSGATLVQLADGITRDPGVPTRDRRTVRVDPGRAQHRVRALRADAQSAYQPDRERSRPRARAPLDRVRSRGGQCPAHARGAGADALPVRRGNLLDRPLPAAAESVSRRQSESSPSFPVPTAHGMSSYCATPKVT
jgi:hypothetical protein